MLYLPKFRLEHQFSAGDMLQALGMRDAFSEASADLSGISGNKDLYISQVSQCSVSCYVSAFQVRVSARLGT